MKKFYIAIGLISILFLSPLNIYGAEVFLNGATLGIDMDVVEDADDLFVPLRQAADIVSAKLSWEESTQTITVYKPFSKTTDDILCELIIDSTQVVLYSLEDGKPLTLDAGTSPRLIDGKTYIPLDFFLDNPVAAVEYDDKLQTININSDTDFLKIINRQND